MADQTAADERDAITRVLLDDKSSAEGRTPPSRRQAIDEIRRFNRHYVPVMRLLDRSYLDTGLSTLEAAALLEIGEHEGCNARDIAKLLHMDKGYLSRAINRFEREGLVRRERAADDARVLRLSLTEVGHKRVAGLVDAGERIVVEAFDGVSDERLAEVARAMELVLSTLEQRGGGADHGE